jgi:tetratricopeptide (TPR) repeat protein
MGATLYALWRRPKLGFLGAWFFVILAPTSSVMPLVGQTMAEHHMYLSLAAPVVLMALGLHAFLGRHGFAAGVVLALALGGLTFERNRDYYTTVSLGADILRIRPDDATSQNSLAVDLQKSGRLTDAVARENSALRMAPDTAEYYYNLGNTYHLLSKPGQARDAYLKAVNLQSDYADAHNNLANIYMIDFGLTDKAMAEYEAALRDDPNYTSAHVNLGNLYIKSDRAADAIPRFNAAIRLQPDFGEAYFGLGDAFLALGRSDDAIPPYETAVRFMPDYAPAHNNLGVALFQMKRIAEAVRQFEETVRLDPDYPHAQENLAKSRPLAPPPPGGVKPLAKPSPLDGPRK